MKRVISMLLVLVLMVGMLPFAAQAATKVSITTQPKSVTVAKGATATVSFTAAGDGLTYTWYYKNKGATSFTKTATFTGNTYTAQMDSTRDGRQIYCVVKDKYGNSVQTNTVTLSMSSAVKITKQPVSVTVAKGATATVSFTAAGDGLTYTWYYKNKGATSFTKTTSFTANSYSVAMDATRDGRQIYCVVKDKYGNTAQTNTVTLSMGNAVKITKQPVSVTVAKGATATVSFTAAGDGLTYTWYYKNKGATSFTKTASFTSNSYSVAMDATRDGRQIYCVVKDKYGNSVQTNTVTLSMSSAVKITKQPVSVTVAKGATATVSFTASGDGLTYTWYYKNKGATSFTKTTSFTSNSYSVAMDATRDGRQIYCVVKDKYGNSVQTNTVTISMGNAAKITKQPVSVTVPNGKIAAVSFTATGDGLTYTWYYKNKGATSFAKTATFTGNTYTAQMDSTRDGRQIYCVVKDKYGNSVQTNTVTISMGNAAKITKQPVSVTVPNGKIAAVSFTATGDGLTYTWYYKNKGATSFAKTATFTGNTYTAQMDSTRDGRQIYCVVKDKYGNSVQTNTVTLSMGTPLVITAQPQNDRGNPGDQATFTVAVSGGKAPYTYQWQMRDYYFDWENLTNGSWFTGVNTNRLDLIVDRDEFVNENKYRCVITDADGNTVISNAAWVEKIPFSFTKDLTSQYVNEGDIVTFEVAVTGGRAPYTYRWMERAYGGRGTPYEQIGGGWYGYNGYTTSCLQIDMSMAGPLFNYTYYCVVTDADGNSITSNVAMICKPLKIDKQPVNTECSLNGSAKFSVAVSGGSMSYSYEWQYRNIAGNYVPVTGLFENATGADTATVSIPIKNSHYFNLKFRCVITDSYGKKVISDDATVTEALTVTSQHRDYWNSGGDLAKNQNELIVNARGGAGGYTYTWYRKNVPTGNNMDDYDFKVMSETSSSLNYNSRNNYVVVIKCVVTDSAGATEEETFWLQYSPY